MPNEQINRPTSKQRVSRIPLDYHKFSDSIRRSRNWITLVAVVLGGGFVAAIGFSKQWLNAAVSPGPVARVHMASTLKCGDCHDSFAAIHEDARQTSSLVRIADSTASIEHNCQKCHPSERHYSGHENVKTMGTCTTCHHEHRGEESSLTETEDRACTRCHDRFPAGFENVPVAAQGIRDFPTTHPRFDLPKSDPTRLKFNHQLHLSPGLKKQSDDRPLPWTLKDVAPDARGKYRRSKSNEAGATQDQLDETAPLQLDCSDCHVSLADKSMGRSTAADALIGNLLNLPRNQSPLQTGAYMLPVKFAEHCAGCHCLTFDRDDDGKAHGVVVAQGTEVPHAVQSERLRDLLVGRGWEKATGEKVTERPEQEQSGKQPARSRFRPFPGQPPERPPNESVATVEKFVGDAETHLRAVMCVKCHQPGAPAEPDGMVSVAPVNMPAIWLQKSHFNHWAHQSVFRNSDEKCLACHSQAKTSVDTSDVLIEGIEKCRECHKPQATQAGADYRCVECHRYHRGDLSALGKAAAHGHGRQQQSAAPLQEGNRASN